MNSHYFLKWVWGLKFQEKNILSIITFILTGILIYTLILVFDSVYPLFLVLVALVLTSGFYIRTLNVIPSILATITVLIVYVLHFRDLMLITLEITFLNLFLFFLLSLLISILIGHLNSTFQKLKVEKISEAKKRWDAEKRKEFLSTLLRQDLASKNQTVWGHLQLITAEELPKEQQEHIKKAKNTCNEIYETLKLTKTLEKIEEKNQTTQIDLTKTIKESIIEINNQKTNQNLNIQKKLPKKPVTGETTEDLKTLIKQIIKTRKQTTTPKNIEITLNQNQKTNTIELQDDGEKLHKDIQKLFSGQTYKGNTTGVWGVRYYLINQIAQHININIQLENTNNKTKFKLKIPTKTQTPKTKNTKPDIT
ncbi:Signal transduction histidine kinase containing PAS domain [Methanonatronarchaeum thermophilum]|uniref:Signal transduction histidine kinase containing PAS domain n=1 Tax=Methanonatronarchaeum thermophilum TaxID=1927129 RepID=A0A1Y3GAG8_9EURY|nr:HAMP domain-containing histidine kinase [Methanonatronarchaeum thermophilum]OUJ18257.1 Signal transduction histidine kinase containing PAS domain [Methanonatronarchaeum thermophilum]